jgi:hypothetical protein
MDIASASNGALNVSDLLDMTIDEINCVTKELKNRFGK